jgi:hypothetical protein
VWQIFIGKTSFWRQEMLCKLILKKEVFANAQDNKNFDFKKNN